MSQRNRPRAVAVALVMPAETASSQLVAQLSSWLHRTLTGPPSKRSQPIETEQTVYAEYRGM